MPKFRRSAALVNLNLRRPRRIKYPDEIKASRSAEATEEARLLRNRRLKVGAVAFVVVTVAASLFGAQIKTVVQEWRRREDIKAAADLAAIEEQIVESTGGLVESPEPHTSSIAPTAAPVLELPINPVQADRELVRQIATLEDRRALLTRQKGQVQAKIERLHERQIREAEMDARRAGSGLER